MIPVFCGRSLVVKHQLPKLRLRVRFSSPAPNFRKQSDLFGLFPFSLHKQRKTAIVSTLNDSGLFSIPNMLVYSLVFDHSIFLFNRHIPQSAISARKDLMFFLSIFIFSTRCARCSASRRCAARPTSVPFPPPPALVLLLHQTESL